MADPLTSQTPDTETAMVDMIDYEAMYRGLEEQRIVLSDQEKKRFYEISQEELKNFNANAVIPNKFGAKILQLWSTITAFVRTLFNGITSEPFGEHLTKAFDKAGEEGRREALDQATIRIHTRLRETGNANLAAAANWLTGQANDGAPQNMQASIYNQISARMALPKDATAGLSNITYDATAATDAPTPGNNATNRPLTQEPTVG